MAQGQRAAAWPRPRRAAGARRQLTMMPWKRTECRPPITPAASRIADCQSERVVSVACPEPSRRHHPGSGGAAGAPRSMLSCATASVGGACRASRAFALVVQASTTAINTFEKCIVDSWVTMALW